MISIILFLITIFSFFLNIVHCFHLLNEFFGRIKHAIGLRATNIAPFALPVMLECTPFAKVMFAFCDNRILKRFSTNETSKWQVIIIAVNFICVRILLTVASLFPFPFQLPAMFVVASIMKKFTAITKTTETSLFVVFANVRLVVPTNCCTQIGWRPYRPLSIIGGERKK